MTWTVYDDRDSSTKRIEIVTMGRTVARMYYKDAEALADAHMIAAAPDMKQALEQIAGGVMDGQACAHLARITLAKAEGR